MKSNIYKDYEAILSTNINRFLNQVLADFEFDLNKSEEYLELTRKQARILNYVETDEDISDEALRNQFDNFKSVINEINTYKLDKAFRYGLLLGINLDSHFNDTISNCNQLK